MNNNEYLRYQTLWSAAKAVYIEKILVLNVYIMKTFNNKVPH